MSFINYLLVFSLFSIGFSYYKIYPVFFFIFIFLSLLNGFKLNLSLFKIVSAFFGLTIISALFNYYNSFDVTTFIKLYINMAFFIAVVSYLRNQPGLIILKIFYLSSFMFLLASSIQVVYLVYLGGLWSMPFSITSSASSYAIQNVSTIYFGDLNKNIWASK